MRRSVAFFLVVAEALVGCAPRPLPKTLQTTAFEGSELIPYRTLTRDDFRGSIMSGAVRAEEQRVHAMICSTIVVRPPDVVTRADSSAAGAVAYVASIDGPIFFSAMSRNCSWWSPDGTLSEEDVLEHVQIHFAIEELEARRLNARADDVARRIYTTGSDLGSVSQRAQGELRSILDGAEQASIERSTVFDLQARDRVRQRQWLHKINAELEATQAYARGPQTSLPTVAPEPLPPPASTPVTPTPAPAPDTPPKPTPSAPAVPASPPQAPPTVSSPGSTVSFPD